MTASRAPRQHLSIQYLRALAAILVVFFHVCFSNHAPVAWRRLDFGQYGVDIFFVISGFIMYTAARHEAFADFWRRRIVRIVPLYWLAIALTIVTFRVASMGFSGSSILKSLLFVPRYNDAFPDKIWPVLTPGWTLAYEMFFYAIFSFGILTRRLVYTVVLSIASCVLLGLYVRPTTAPMVVYTNPLLLEFLIGFLIGILHRRYPFGVLRPLLPLGLALLVASNFLGLPRWSYGVLATFIVAGGLGWDDRYRIPLVPFAKLLGDGSYSIYLVHTQVILLIDLYASRLLDGSWIMRVDGVAVLGMVVSIAAGLVVHRWLEKPLLRLSSRHWPGRRREPVVLPAS